MKNGDKVMAPIVQGIGKLYYAKATIIKVSSDTSLVRFEDGIENTVVTDMCYRILLNVVLKDTAPQSLLQVFLSWLSGWHGTAQ